ncbi:MAG: glycosyltransferase family 39 protein [Chloroflexota bacterium]
MASDRLTSVAVGAILLVALGLRLFLLTGQSLWYDEGVSAYMTPRTFAEIAAATSVDIHPPLYYWLLATWAAAFGQGEAALRSLSVVFGTLTVWVTWKLGQLVAGRATGLAAATLLAVSPLAVQYSQEVRMYAQAGLLAAASSWAGLALLRALTGGTASRRQFTLLSLAYGLLAGALLYTHYYGTLVVAAQQVFAGLALLTSRRWRIVPWWGLASGLAAALFLPWLPVALRQTGYYPGLGSPHPAWALVLDAFNVLSIGIATTRFGFRAGLAPFLGLAALGVGWLALRSGFHLTKDVPLPPHPYSPPWGPSPSTNDGAPPLRGIPVSADPHGPVRGRGGVRQLPLPLGENWGEGVSRTRLTPQIVYLLLWLLLPLAGIVILSQTRPLYEPRFLMLVLPAWVILLGAGLVALGQGAGTLLTGQLGLPPAARQIAVVALAMVVAVSLLIPTARSLASYYFDPVYARDDYRGLAQTIMLREQPDDAIILTAPGQVEIFGYYFHGQADLFPLPQQRPIDPADTRARLEALAETHDRVWLVRWAANEADPDDLILGWLEGRGRRLGNQSFGRVELRLYDLRGIASRPPGIHQRGNL